MKAVHPVTRASGRFAKALLSLIVVTGGIARIFAAELVNNGTFEAGNTGFTSEFTYVPSGPGALDPADVYTITNDPQNDNAFAASYGDHTTGFGLMMAVNGTITGNKQVWSETVSVVSGEEYVFSLYTSTWSGGAGNLQLLINGTALAPEFSSGVDTTWTQTSQSWTADSETAVLEIFNTSGNYIGNDFALDDISFTGPLAVPEAETWVLPCLVTTLLVARFLLRQAKGRQGRS